MEIDIRETPEPKRVETVLAAVPELDAGDVLTVLCAEDPAGLEDSLRNVLGAQVDLQTMRWGIKDLPWLLHVKKSRMPSAYHPPEA